MTDNLDPVFTTVGDEIMEAIDVILQEAFSDLEMEDPLDPDPAPAWPVWLFGEGAHADIIGGLVTENMVPPVHRAALEAGVGMAGDLATLVGLGATWATVMDVALTYAVRVGLHVAVAINNPDVELFFDEDYVRTSLIETVNRAVELEQEDE